MFPNILMRTENMSLQIRLNLKAPPKKKKDNLTKFQNFWTVKSANSSKTLGLINSLNSSQFLDFILSFYWYKDLWHDPTSAWPACMSFIRYISNDYVKVVTPTARIETTYQPLINIFSGILFTRLSKQIEFNHNTK